MKLLTTTTLLMLLASGFVSFKAYAQVSVQCGDIIESEFIEEEEVQEYRIELSAGDTLEISGTVLGNQLEIGFFIAGPTNQLISSSDEDINETGAGYLSGEAQPEASSGILSASGEYSIYALNYEIWYDRFINFNRQSWDENGPGLYTLFVGCTLRDGTVIEPGMLPNDEVADGTTTSNTTAQSVTFSGTGFPGLSPVEFSNVASIPIPMGTPMSGAITPTGGEIIGYILDGATGDNLRVDVGRLSGNLNIGVVVLYNQNQVIYQASMNTAQNMSVDLVLPESATYTVGIFRLDLLPPANPEATAFQITAAINP